MKPSFRVRLALAIAIALVLVAYAATGAAARKAPRRPEPFSAITRDLNRDGRIDAVDLRGAALPTSAREVRVQGFRVLALEPLRGGRRVLLAERSTPDTALRPDVYVGRLKVRALDGAAPVVLRLSTEDIGDQGHIDDIRLTLSESPSTRGLASAFYVSGYQIRAAHVRGDVVDLALVPHPEYDTGARPVVTIGNLRDRDGNRSPRAETTPADGAAPVLTSAPTAERGGDGTLDAIELAFSEPVIVDAGAVQVQGYQVVGTRDYPDGLLSVLLHAAAPPGTGNPPVTLDGADLRDGAGNQGPSGPVGISAGAMPVMIGAQDEGFWLDGEKIVTIWSAPVTASGPGGADSFSMSDAIGKPIVGSGISAGAAPNEIDVNLPLGSETPNEISYTGSGATSVVDAAGYVGEASGSSMPVVQIQPQFAGTVSDPIDQDQMLPFGERSFYLQPWRSYSDTFPATRMLNAVGINFNVPNSHTEEIDAGAKLLHDAGFAHARIEASWNEMDYQNPGQLSAAQLPLFTNELQQFHANGIRPLILLNSNDQIPTPVQNVTLNVTAPAAEGATQVQLDSASAALVQPRLTGFNQYGRDAGVIITAVNGSGLATLSQPLQTAIAAGPQTAVDLAFQPFFPEYNTDGSPNTTNEATLNGWLQYVAGVTQTAKSILGNDNFDIEVWNELSFGSAFLDASNYYNPAPQGSGSITQELLTATVDYIRNPANGLTDVGIGDGFTNESPFTGGASEVPGVTAIDKHPYESAIKFPSQATFNGVRPVDALGNPAGTQVNGQWQDAFVPSFTALFPEYFLSGIQTENVTRDLAPFVSDIYGGLHGRGTHPPGAPAPQMWVTEVNEDASTVNDTLTSLDGSATSPMSAADIRHFETKAILRYLSAWVGKGATVIDFFAADDAGDLDVVDSSFWTQADSINGYPGLAAGGDTILAVRRFLDTMSGAQNLGQTQPLTLDAISDYDGAYQLAGNGTAAYPPLYNRDLIGFFPFQVTQHKWVIPTYVMTQNLATLYNPSAPTTDVTRQDLPQEVYRLTVGGVDPDRVTASATDPITGDSVPVKITGRGSGTVSLEIPLTDYPRMLTLEDG